MRLGWDDIRDLLDLLFSIRSEVRITYTNLQEIVEQDYAIFQNMYVQYMSEICEINWEYGNTEIRIEPKYRYVRIKTPDLELVRLIRTACVNKHYADLEISLSLP